MNPTNNRAQNEARIKEVISQNKAGVIILPLNPSQDALAAASAFYLSLLKMGKIITLACSSEVKGDLLALDKVQHNLSVNGDSLVVSFPYTDGAIDRVDYNIQGENFNLIITPRPSFPKLDKNQVKFSYTGGQFQFIIVIDSPNLNSLGELYENNQNQFQGKEIINIDRHLINSYYGTINLVDKTISSISELVFKTIKNLEIEIDKDIATNLYFGMVTATNNFTSYSVNAQTFENAAQLLRLGAVKKIIKKSPIKTSPQYLATGHSENQTIKPLESVEKETMPEEKPQTPQEWLKPKIFKGSGLI